MKEDPIELFKHVIETEKHKYCFEYYMNQRTDFYEDNCEECIFYKLHISKYRLTLLNFHYFINYGIKI